ncbi:hypothetical protein L7F22_022306 [Adiantum nelumboides]|nr:hypothetical protein [Adiantum nelumboides]
MSTNKLLQSLSEDPQLEKQIGCMTGILQLFDRHQVLTGRRLYGNKRIAAAASKLQTPTQSTCGSPSSDSSGPLNENLQLRVASEEPRLKHAPAAGVFAPVEQQKSQPVQMPAIPTETKSSLAFARTPSLTPNEPPVSDAYSRGQLPKISFDTARSSLLAPRRLDSSRSLHEARINVAHESKVYARKSVDTAERAAAAARGALKELSRITNDYTGPAHQEDELSIRDIVRSSLGHDQQTPRSSANSLLSSASSISPYPHRLANEGIIGNRRGSLPKDVSRAHNVDFKSSLECHPLQVSITSMPQTGERVDAPRPPRPHCKPKAEPPPKSCADIDESLRLLAKLREASPTYNNKLGHEEAEHTHGSRDSSATHHVPQQGRPSLVEGPAISSRASLPRAASDRVPGRMSSYEPSRASSVDAFLLGGPKTREGHRLSLDSRGGIKADQGLASQGNPHPRTLLNSRSVSCSNSDCDTESLQEKRTSFSSNVVAKLMGLDEIPSGELPHAHPKHVLSSSSDQKIKQESNIVMHDMNPTFSQCGKYVSASFFPSKRRDDIPILTDSDKEEDSYLHLEPLSQQEARTLNVRVGSLKLQAGDRLVTTENGNHLGHPCYQPKNHHLMEDRPPHVLSPAARLCAQIEAMQRGDTFYKGNDSGRTVGLQQSSNSELEALKQLLGTLHPKKDYAISSVDKPPMQEPPKKLQHESARSLFLPQPRQQAEQPMEVAWKTKKMLNDDFDSQRHEHNNTGRRRFMDIHNGKIHNGMPGEAPQPSYRQYKLLENYNQSPLVQEDAYFSPGSSASTMYNTPRKALSPGTARNLQISHVKRTVVHPHTAPNGQAARLLTSPRTPSTQQLRLSSNGNCSWEAASVSSTSSSNARDHYVSGSSSYQAANKQNKQSERGAEKKKMCILKDKKESKASLVSLKPSPMPPTEKKAKSGVVVATVKSDSRKLRKPVQAQNTENSKSSTSTPTRSTARKAVDVSRKLNFSNRSHSGRPSYRIEDQESEFVDKKVVGSTISSQSSNSSVELHEVRPDGMEQDSRMSVDNDLGFFVNKPANISYVRTEGGVKSPLLLLAAADAEASIAERQTTSTIVGRDGAEASTIQTPKGALRLPPTLQPQENEDTESQGDKSTGSCEQPSPVSVLEGPFYEDDVASPPTATKFVLKLEELKEKAREESSAGEHSVQQSPPLLMRTHSSPQDEPLTDFNYVKHLVDASCLPQCPSAEADRVGGVWKLRPVNSHYFLQLEEEAASNHGQNSAYKAESGSSMWRRMLFDSVNASLERRMHPWRLCQHQPWLLACERNLHGTIARGCSAALRQGIVGVDEGNNVCLSSEGKNILLEEVWEEIEANIAKQGDKVCTQQGVIGSIRGEGEEEGGACDELIHMLEMDILGGPQSDGLPNAWADLLVEKGELGLDLERLIFKDLIDHTIRDLGLLLHPSLSLTTKRQLFKFHN